MTEKIILTKKGLQELKKELNFRLTKERKRIADEIERARQQGDLSENSAYKAAMENKDFNEIKIQELQSNIDNSEVVEKIGKGKVELGANVEILDTNTKISRKFIIVGENEADPSNSKISCKSPLAILMLGKKVGQYFEFSTPISKINYKIVKVD